MERDLKYNGIIRNENFPLVDLMLMPLPFEGTKKINSFFYQTIP